MGTGYYHEARKDSVCAPRCHIPDKLLPVLTVTRVLVDSSKNWGPGEEAVRVCYVVIKS